MPVLCYLKDECLVLRGVGSESRRVIKGLEGLTQALFSWVIGGMLFVVGRGQLSAVWLKASPEWTKLSFRLKPIEHVVTYLETEDEFEEKLQPESVGSWDSLMDFSGCLWGPTSLVLPLPQPSSDIYYN
jgi:hypothetical protein